MNEEKKPTIIQRVKQWPVSVALATGIAIGSAGTYEVTKDTYAPDAVITETKDTKLVNRKNIIAVDTLANDSVTTESEPLPDAVERPEIREPIDSLITGDELRVVLFKNGKIIVEAVRNITEPPLPPNDCFSGVLKLDIREDKK